MKSGLGYWKPVYNDQGQNSFLIETILPTPEIEAGLSSGNTRMGNAITEIEVDWESCKYSEEWHVAKRSTL